jgi:hypothetical protein
LQESQERLRQRRARFLLFAAPVEPHQKRYHHKHNQRSGMRDQSTRYDELKIAREFQSPEPWDALILQESNRVSIDHCEQRAAMV